MVLRPDGMTRVVAGGVVPPRRTRLQRSGDGAAGVGRTRARREEVLTRGIRRRDLGGRAVMLPDSPT